MDSCGRLKSVMGGAGGCRGFMDGGVSKVCRRSY